MLGVLRRGVGCLLKIMILMTSQLPLAHQKEIDRSRRRVPELQPCDFSHGVRRARFRAPLFKRRSFVARKSTGIYWNLLEFTGVWASESGQRE